LILPLAFKTHFGLFWSPGGIQLLRGQAALKLDEHRFEVKTWLKDGASIEPVYTSALGALFAADCMEVLPHIKSGVVDMVFADPPFNLGKEYGGIVMTCGPTMNCLK